ncbi:hypothetical protein ACFWPA_09095 [Rhodococcus sp. NPDC058505]|uniref:hypothetical protein n=1 Tax=Rhodococcus sp. NPDC058505 TaxID=3346531 RepID=UPI003657292A
MNEFDPAPHPDPARHRDPVDRIDAGVARSTWVIGVAAALVLGIAIGAVMNEAAAAPAPGGACEQRSASGAATAGPRTAR